MENIYNPLVINKDKSLEERTRELLEKLDSYMLYDEIRKTQSESSP